MQPTFTPWKKDKTSRPIKDINNFKLNAVYIRK